MKTLLITVVLLVSGCAGLPAGHTPMDHSRPLLGLPADVPAFDHSRPLIGPAPVERKREELRRYGLIRA